MVEWVASERVVEIGEAPDGHARDGIARGAKHQQDTVLACHPRAGRLSAREYSRRHESHGKSAAMTV